MSSSSRSSRKKDGKDKEKEGSRHRSRSRSPVRQEEPAAERVMTVDDLKQIVAETIAQQMPSMIIEASKVAKETISSDRDESGKAMAAEMKKLKQSHQSLELVSKAASLKSEGIYYLIIFVLTDIQITNVFSRFIVYR